MVRIRAGLAVVLGVVLTLASSGPALALEGLAGDFVPDPALAAGPDSIVATVNHAIAIWDKDGTPVASATLDEFYGPGLFTTDSRVLYDRLSGRFFVVTSRLDEAG